MWFRPKSKCPNTNTHRLIHRIANVKENISAKSSKTFVAGDLFELQLIFKSHLHCLKDIYE